MTTSHDDTRGRRLAPTSNRPRPWQLHGLGAAALALCAVTASAQRAPAATTPVLSLCPGFTIVTAISQPQGDYESIKRIESTAGESTRIRYSSYRRMPGHEYTGGPRDPPWIPFVVYRSVRHVDRDASASYMQIFDPEGVPETVKGTTALGISRQSFRELRDRGATKLTIFQGGGELGVMIDDTGRSRGLGEYRLSGELTRVDPTPVTVPVLVNGRLTDLPALRARGQFLWDDSEFYFLFDERNPIALKFAIGIPEPPPPEQLIEDAKLGPSRGPARARDNLQVLRITHDCDAPSLPAAAGRTAGAPSPAGGGGPGIGPSTSAGSGGAGGANVPEGVGRGAAPPAAGAGGGTASAAAVARLETALADTGRADVYSVYFAFNSDEIREESADTLAEIAEVLGRHPEWKLTIEGHTDSVASDSFNQQLSERRAAAVRTALVSGKGIASDRLSSAGFGESRPKATNDTVEGRALNRRVELVRRP